MAGPVVGRVERPGLGGAVYVIDDVACRAVGGTLAAGDDADEVRWVDAAGFAALDLVDGLAEALAGWGVLPTSGDGPAAPRPGRPRGPGSAP